MKGLAHIFIGMIIIAAIIFVFVSILALYTMPYTSGYWAIRIYEGLKYIGFESGAYHIGGAITSAAADFPFYFFSVVTAIAGMFFPVARKGIMFGLKLIYAGLKIIFELIYHFVPVVIRIIRVLFPIVCKGFELISKLICVGLKAVSKLSSRS